MGKGRQLVVLQLTDRQKRLLEQHHARRSTSSGIGFRIAIILGAHAGLSTSTLARQLQSGRNDVARWRNRWIEAYESLCHFEQGPDAQGVSDRDLLLRMLTILRDAPRCGAPKRITLEQVQQLTAMACRKPTDYGIPVTQWTHELLATAAEEQGLIEQISPRYVGVLLKKKQAPTS